MSGKVKLMLKEVRELKIKINKVNKIFILCEKLQFCLLKAWIRFRAHFRDPAFIRKCICIFTYPRIHIIIPLEATRMGYISHRETFLPFLREESSPLRGPAFIGQCLGTFTYPLNNVTRIQNPCTHYSTPSNEKVTVYLPNRHPYYDPTEY